MVILTGDTHGMFDRIEDFCAEYDTTIEDIVIILGDAGINYWLDERDEELKARLSRLPITLFCIHGNHEERPEEVPGYDLTEWMGGQAYVQKEYPNLLFAEDGEIYEFNGKKAIAIGGAYSAINLSTYPAMSTCVMGLICRQVICSWGIKPRSRDVIQTWLPGA